ncbi:MAG: PoNe immunity protein domain-containing protein [Bacteroidota bacterium]
MIRDKLKDIKYFDEFITRLYKSQERRYEKLANNAIKKERIPIVKRDMSGNYLRIIYAKYSRGDNMFSNNIYAEFLNSLKLMSENWEENFGRFIHSQKNKAIVLNQYSFSMYLSLLDRLSIAILLDLEASQFKQLFQFVDKDNVKDFLLEFLMGYYDTERPPITEESYQEFFHINERFGRLKTIIKEENKTTAEQELKYFLEKEWYDSFKGTPLYNQHLNPNDTYSGYWCFVAAAIVKIKGLDDSSFRANAYYPKDMLV